MTTHVPVMLPEVLRALAPRDGAVYLDGTFGGGGYARAVLEAASCTLWAIDRDPEAIRRGAALAAGFPGRLHLLHGRFGDAVALLGAHGVDRLDGVMLDLGVSSFQLDDPARGFSFRHDGPLDMRMGARDGTTAAELVNTLGEAELADALFRLGEERLSRRVARAIVRARTAGDITTTAQLAEIVRGVVPRDRGGADPATRSFQALRLLVNDELGEVERGLLAAARLVAPGGRLVVVSFHSLEDRIVKRFLQDESGRAPGVSRHAPEPSRSRPARFAPLAGGLGRPDQAELRANPRARSARLRAAIRLDDVGADGPRTPEATGMTAR